MKFISIHHGNMIAAERVVAVLNPQSMPVKRMIQAAREDKRLIDASGGKKTKAVLVTDSDHVILSSVQTTTLAKHLSDKEDVKESEEDAEEDE